MKVMNRRNSTNMMDILRQTKSSDVNDGKSVIEHRTAITCEVRQTAGVQDEE